MIKRLRADNPSAEIDNARITYTRLSENGWKMLSIVLLKSKRVDETGGTKLITAAQNMSHIVLISSSAVKTISLIYVVIILTHSHK